MENKVATFSRLRFLAAAFFIFQGAVVAQKIGKYYTSNLQEKGMLYYISPQKHFHAKSGGGFIYDITCMSKSDSVTLNFSYFDAKPMEIKQLVLPTNSGAITTKAQKLFVDSKKNKWHYRYTTKISYVDLQNFFAVAASPAPALETANGNIALRTSKKSWRKYSAINKKIFQLINYNL